MTLKSGLVLFLLFLSIFAFSEDLWFGNYDIYKNSNFKSSKWDYSIKSGYKNIEKGRVFYQAAYEDFLIALDKGCRYPQLIIDILLIEDELKKKNEYKNISYLEILKKYFDKALINESLLNLKRYDKIEGNDLLYLKISDILLKEGRQETDEKAAIYLEKIENKTAEVVLKLANIDFNSFPVKIDLAEKYYLKAENQKGFENLGDYYFNAKMFEKSLFYYEKSKNYDKIEKVKKLNSILKSFKKYNGDSNYFLENMPNPNLFNKEEVYFVKLLIPVKWINEKLLSAYCVIPKLSGDLETNLFYVNIGDVDGALVKNNKINGTDFGIDCILTYDGMYNSGLKFKLIYVFPANKFGLF